MLTTTLRTRLPLVNRAAAASARRHMGYEAGGESLQTWIAELTSRPPVVDSEVLSSGRAEQLLRSLPTRAVDEAAGSKIKGVLPKAFHLAYFQPTDWLSALAADGTSTEYNAPAPFSRRMWAGGAFEWNTSDADAALRVDEEATQSVSVGGVSVKSPTMMFVKQLREFRRSSAPEGSWAVREERNHVFQSNEQVLANQNKTKAPPQARDMPPPQHSLVYTPTSPLLFRYSALTFNAHKIHYDIEWTRKMEGHPDLVVHGPMTATLLVERADKLAGDAGLQLQRFEYRATSPMYVDREITLQAVFDQRNKTALLWAEQDGNVGMKATATFV